jgi:EmrB/QacA subfamily drug resistance transporter
MTDRIDSSAPPVLDHAAIRSIVIGIMLAMFLGALDQTIVATALPTIGRRFGEVENLSWVVTAYLLTATASTPLYGKLSDIYGRRAMMLLAIGIFAVGSVACALAPSLTALAFARALQGLGGGGLLSLSQIIVGDIVAPKERGRYQGYFGFVFALASVGGPVLGGVLAEHLHWSLIFWINLPLGALALAMTYRALARMPRHERRHRLDVLGAGLVVAATVALLLALTWGGTRYSWGSPQIVALLAGSVVLGILFAARLATAPEPFLPLEVLGNPVVGFGTASVACIFGTMIGLSIFVPLYFEVVLHLSASQSGLALIPLMGGTVAGSTISGQLMARVARYKLLPVIGLVLAIAGIALLAAKPQGLPPAVIAVALGLAGIGLGSVFPVTTVSVQNAVLPWQMGTATGAMNFFRQLFGAIIVAGFGAIVLGGGMAAGGIEALAAVASRAGIDLAEAFRWVFVAAAGMLALGLAFLIAMEERPLRSAPIPAAPREPSGPASVPAE